METCKDWYRKGDPNAHVPKLIVGLFGGFAGACSVLGNTPLDVVKTRIQTLKKGKGEESYRGVGEAICKIVRSEGLVGLLRGMVSRSLITGSMFGISQMVYFSDFTGYLINITT